MAKTKKKTTRKIRSFQELYEQQVLPEKMSVKEKDIFIENMGQHITTLQNKIEQLEANTQSSFKQAQIYKKDFEHLAIKASAITNAYQQHIKQGDSLLRLITELTKPNRGEQQNE